MEVNSVEGNEFKNNLFIYFRRVFLDIRDEGEGILG